VGGGGSWGAGVCSTYEVINQEARESWRLLRAGILVDIDRRLPPARRAALRYWENDYAPARPSGSAAPSAARRCASPGTARAPALPPRAEPGLCARACLWGRRWGGAGS
jgi:hypothetical protein